MGARRALRVLSGLLVFVGVAPLAGVDDTSLRELEERLETMSVEG